MIIFVDSAAFKIIQRKIIGTTQKLWDIQHI